MRSLGRSDEHAREKRPRLPGRPARRVGPLHAEQRHFSGYSFGAKRVPLRTLFVIAPQGALLSFEDETCEDKRYPNAVSHSLRSKRHADLLGKRPKESHRRPSAISLPLRGKDPRTFNQPPAQGAAAAASLAPGFPCDKQQLR